MARASNIILVHGAWADGSSWSKVIPLLRSRGLKVTAVQLPLTSFDADAGQLRTTEPALPPHAFPGRGESHLAVALNRYRPRTMNHD